MIVDNLYILVFKINKLNDFLFCDMLQNLYLVITDKIVISFRLRKQLETHSTCRLHQMLAEFLTQTHEHQEALDQFSIALRLGYMYLLEDITTV